VGFFNKKQVVFLGWVFFTTTLPKSPPLMMSLTKNPNPKPKKCFSLQTRRFAESFQYLNSSLTVLVTELCPCKATCDPAVFTWNAWINLAAEVLKGFCAWTEPQVHNFNTWKTNLHIKKIYIKSFVEADIGSA